MVKLKMGIRVLVRPTGPTSTSCLIVTIFLMFLCVMKIPISLNWMQKGIPTDIARMTFFSMLRLSPQTNFENWEVSFAAKDCFHNYPHWGSPIRNYILNILQDIKVCNVDYHWQKKHWNWVFNFRVTSFFFFNKTFQREFTE